MRPIYENKLIQLEITNACQFNCSNCTRMVGHHRKPFFMTLDEVENALKSLVGFPGNVGLIGGEPTLHPDFLEILKLLRKYVHVKAYRGLWTNGYKWDEYKKEIEETFHPETIYYNDHSIPDFCWHQPLLIGIEEVIEDPDLRWKIIENCWVQNRWSASITPKGCFFCEVAAAQDHLFDGPGGWPVENGWWRRDVWCKDFQDQVRRYCPRCSACLPMKMKVNSHDNFDVVSPRNLEKLKKLGSPKIKQERYKVADCKKLAEYVGEDVGEPMESQDYWMRGTFTKHLDWHPWHYQLEKHHDPSTRKGERVLTEKQIRELQGVGKETNEKDTDRKEAVAL